MLAVVMVLAVILRLGGDMAFQGLLTATITIKGSLSGTMGNESSLSGIVALNKMEMIDAVDYFRTEDNINFLVTEDGNYLEI